MLVKLNVAVAHTLGISICYFGHRLSRLVHKIVFNKPLAHKLLRELALRLSLFKLLFVAICIKIATAIRCMNLIDKVNLTVTFTEFVFRVNENESLFSGYFLSATKQFACVVFDNRVVFGRYHALTDNLFTRDIKIVPLIGFGCRCNDRFGETLVFAHTFGQFNTTQLALSVFIRTPSTTREDGTNYHLHPEPFAFKSHGNHRVGRSEFPIGADVACSIQKLGCNLIENLPFKGDAFG